VDTVRYKAQDTDQVRVMRTP